MTTTPTTTNPTVADCLFAAARHLDWAATAKAAGRRDLVAAHTRKARRYQAMATR